MAMPLARREDAPLAFPTVVPMARLDPYAGGLACDGPRIEALATISCGYRAESRQEGRPGLPRASRRDDERQIHLKDPQGRAPGLRAALEASGGRSLLIAFPLDDPNAFIQQRFTRYSQTRLEAYGDAQSVTWIDPGDAKATPPKDPSHRTFPIGDERYERLVKTCKADTRIYFALAEWGEEGPEVVFPDGLGLYAIRTTSRHSVRSIQQTLEYTRQFTRGRIAGMPFVLEVDYREVAGPDGSKRTIPVWTITTRPPQGIRLSSRTFQGMATAALSQGAALMLPAPTELTLEDAEREGPAADVEEPTEEELGLLGRGGTCDARFYEAAWFARVKDTSLGSDEARAAFLRDYTRGATDSLGAFLARATEEEAAALIAAAGARVGREKTAGLADRYAEIFGGEDEDGPRRQAAIEGTAVEIAVQPEEDGAAGPHGASTTERAPEPAQPAPAVPAPAQTTRAQALKRWRNLLEEASSFNIAPAEDPVRSTTSIGEIERLCEELAEQIGARVREEAGGAF